MARPAFGRGPRDIRPSWNEQMGSIRRTFAAHVPLYACGMLSVTMTAAILKAYGIAPRFEAGTLFLGGFAIFVGIIVFSSWQRRYSGWLPMDFRILWTRSGFGGMMPLSDAQ